MSEKKKHKRRTVFSMLEVEKVFEAVTVFLTVGVSKGVVAISYELVG